MRSCGSAISVVLGALLWLTATVGVGCSDAGTGGRWTVAAAASLTDVMGDAVERWNVRGGSQATLAVGASSTLARQMEHGAPYGLFVSAHPDWAAALVKAGLVEPKDRAVLARNQLVIIGPKGITGGASSGAPIKGHFLAGERWALADPSHVPAGVLAREAASALGVWEQLEPKVIPVRDVRAVVGLVARGEVDFGVVYATDVGQTADVSVVASIDPKLHTPALVVACAASSAGSDPKEFLTWLRGPEGLALFRQYGFQPPEGL